MTAAGLLVAIPFLAAVGGLLLGAWRPRLAAPVAIGATALGTVLSGVVLARALRAATGALPDPVATVATGGPPISVVLQPDRLAGLVAVAVTVVALSVQVYSVGYLRGDPRYSSYAALVSLFTSAMLLVVLAGDLLVLFVGWEVMGICSYFLVGHHWEQHEARAAAVKAFLTTRIGDVLLLFGIFVLGSKAGSFRIADALTLHDPSTVALLLVLGGAVGKSAQFPLHVWLPDAMAGPTPISALIHAATMVAAGVFLVLRLWPLFAVDPTALAVLGVLAALTMTGSALVALAQPDLKRVLAWSTVSQLAFMFAALATGAPVAATFHLLTHAAFKALLFLCAGAVMHAVGTSLLADMGGLRRTMPITFATMTLGLLALVGVPPLSGFFSKESVLSAAEETALHGGVSARWVGWMLLVCGVLTVALTAAYSTRIWLLTFLGPRRGAAAAQEAPATMRWPLVALAVPTLLLGVLALPAVLPAALSRLPADAADVSLAPSLATSVASIAALMVGALAPWAVWRRAPAADPAARLGALQPVLASAFGVDALYGRTVIAGFRALAALVLLLDRDVVDAYVRSSGRSASLLARGLQFTQRGNVQRYLALLGAGVVILAVTGAVR